MRLSTFLAATLLATPIAGPLTAQDAKSSVEAHV